MQDDNRNNHTFSDEDREKSELMREIKREMRSTQTLLEIKKQFLDLQKSVKGMSNDTPESAFFTKVVDILGQKFEDKILNNQNSASTNKNSAELSPQFKELSDAEFIKVVIPQIEKLPAAAKEQVKFMYKQNPEQQKKEIVATCNNYSIAPSEQQVNKVLEIITGEKIGC